MHAQAEAIFERLGVRLDPDRIARGLSIAEQQLVEIAKALSLDARVIVMDEPTAALSAVEVERLFGVATTLRESGRRRALHLAPARGGLRALPAGDRAARRAARPHPRARRAERRRPRPRDGRPRPAGARADASRASARPCSSVERLTREGVFVDISFAVRAGEIVALAGLVGAGRSEVARAIFGIDSLRRRLGDRRPGGGSGAARRAAAMAAGIGFVPEDRRLQGLVMSSSITRNIALASLGRLQRLGFIRSSVERRFAADWALRLQIKYGRLSNPVSSLSGGNQQKVVLAKWLARRPSLLIVDEPTRGIDVGDEGGGPSAARRAGRRRASRS